jgi:hypothetical protein
VKTWVCGFASFEKGIICPQFRAGDPFVSCSLFSRDFFAKQTKVPLPRPATRHHNRTGGR